jgi:uncharacterized protein YhhL (DUF1145 family)
VPLAVTVVDSFPGRVAITILIAIIWNLLIHAAIIAIIYSTHWHMLIMMSLSLQFIWTNK